jgi:hypothetical protein
MSATVTAAHRFTARNLCPVCGGHANLPARRGVRCYGFLSIDGRYARCTREEYAIGLPQETCGSYAHRLDGPCRCGTTHGGSITANGHSSLSRGRPDGNWPPAQDPQPSPHERLCPVGFVEERAYPWTESDGTVVYESVRYRHTSERQTKVADKFKKTFQVHRPVPGQPGWCYSTRGNAPLVVFRKDQLAASPGADLHWPEGEEHVLALELQ